MDNTQKKQTKFNRHNTLDPWITKLNVLLYMVAGGVLADIERYFNDGGDMTLSDYDDRTALHLSASEGHYDIVVFLLGKCRVDMYAKDRWGHTALDEAVRFGHKRVEAFMRGYSYSKSNQDAVNLTDSIEIKQSYKKRKRDDRNTDASQLTSDPGDTTPSPRKPEQTTRWKFKSLLMYLTHKGDLNALKCHVDGYVGWLYKTDFDKRTVLHVAAADGQAHIVSYLMDIVHMDLNVKDRWGNTPYMEAKRFKRTNVVNVLKKYMTKEEIVLADVPEIKQLYQIARNIGQEWELLGHELGVSNAKIAQIRMDKEIVVEKIGSMLVAWRQEYYYEATFEKLYAAMHAVGIHKDDACKALTYS